MSKSAKIVSRSLLNKHCVSVELGFLRFRIYQPFIRDLARAFAGEAGAIVQISRLLFKSAWAQKTFLWYVRRYATYSQIKDAAMNIAIVVTGKDLFEAVKIDKTKRKTESQTVGNNTITGMMSSMIEQLNITYKEASQSINYPTMLLMMIDKCRALTGGEEKIINGSGKMMAERRKRRK